MTGKKDTGDIISQNYSESESSGVCHKMKDNTWFDIARVLFIWYKYTSAALLVAMYSLKLAIKEKGTAKV